ncbi:serine-type endopeptidase [Aureococcus anophagefferens]|jgi:membrane associated rhomboid family serine protease|uniref:Serine-type endopeptidase n=2 Tax=Aureococcus anophagefferens TaxID=44056 RepID=A0ABR1GFA5_AURAN|nr:serine-type endopeptidase [Aureococcus anophagefferens]
MRSILALATAVAASMQGYQAPSQYARQRVARSAAPLVTEKITYTTVGAYGAQVLQPQLLTLGCKSAPLIGAGQWWRLATPMLLHASPAHLIVNMISLRNVGRSLERAYGAKKTLVVYVASGIAGNLLSCAKGPVGSTSVGASGAIAGLIGALAVHLYRHQELYGTRGLDSIRDTVLLNALLGATAGNIDNMAHLGGLLGGAAVGVAFGARWQPRFNVLGQPVGYVDRPLLRLPF